MSNFFSKFRLNLVQRIILGLILGLVLGLLFPRAVWIGTLGGLFVGSLKAIAPLLVFVLVISSLASSSTGFDRRFGFVIFEYMFSTFLAALTAVFFCFRFPVKLTLVGDAVTQTAPGSVCAGNRSWTCVT